MGPRTRSPLAGGSTGGAPNGTPRTGPRGIPVSYDYTQWHYWWNINQDRFLNLKGFIYRPATVTSSDDFFMGPSRRMDGMDTMRPTAADIQTRILPALKRALDATDQRDITTNTLFALARIGRNHAKFDILPIFTRHLPSSDQAVRDAATMALGISGMPQALEPLRQLVLDTDRARRELVKKTFVDYRVRAFAAYGMGLVAYLNDDRKLKRTVVETMAKVLQRDQVRRDLRVAAIHALSLLNTRDDAILNPALDALDKFYGRKLGRGEQLVQSHVPPAVAKLLGRGPGSAGRRLAAKELYLRELASSKRSNDIYRGVAIALGRLCEPEERNASDKKYSEALFEFFNRGRDHQARYFALMALGQIGGEANRDRLLSVLSQGRKALERPWAGLALGVLSYRVFQNDADAVPDRTVGEALLQQFETVKTPSARGAFAVGLGLCRHRPAGSTLLRALEDNKHQDLFAGHLCLGLALMDYQKARPRIQAVCRGAAHRPRLLALSASALGRLGDHTVTDTLIGLLRETTNTATLSAISVALGYIGDRRTIVPLLQKLGDDSLTPLSRAYGASALGAVGDKETLPWNSKLARNINYRATVETLLDIL